VEEETKGVRSWHGGRNTSVGKSSPKSEAISIFSGAPVGSMIALRRVQNMTGAVTWVIV
jgi:hypothetical protein